MNKDDLIKVYKQGPVTFYCYQTLDEYPDLSWLGEYTSNPKGEYYINRRDGIFYGPSVREERSHPVELWEDGEPVDVDLNDNEELTDWNEDTHTIIVEGPAVLAMNLSTNYDRNSYEYFEPPIENYGVDDLKESVKYCIQDYERMESYNQDYWYMTGVIVRAYIEGEKVAESSLWGIESDAGDYVNEVIKDCISECISQLNKTYEHLSKVVDILKEISPDELEEEELEEIDD